jgi:Plasmid stabilization system protein
MKIIWSPRAIKRLDELFEWLREKSDKSAIAIYNDLFDSVKLLEDFPSLAPIEPILSHLNRTYRSLVIRNNYKVVYYTEGSFIYISTVWDCRQNPKKLKHDL